MRTMQDKLSESPRCNNMVANLHFPRFFSIATQCEIAWHFLRSVVKVGLNFNAKISVFWVEFNLEPRWIWNYYILIHNMWAIQILKRGICRTPCKPMRNLAKILMLSKHALHPQQMLLIPNALCCSLYKSNCVCPSLHFFTSKKLLPTSAGKKEQ